MSGFILRNNAVAKIYIAIMLIVVIAAVFLGAYVINQAEQPANKPEASPTLPATASPTSTAIITLTPTPTVSATPSPILTPSPTPSVSPTPSLTFSPTPTPTLTATATPSQSPSPTPSPTASPSPSPTASPTPTPSLSPSPTPLPTLIPTQPPVFIKATNWAGYVVATDLQTPQPNVTGVSGSWTVPSVTTSTTDSFCAVWIGVGGQFDRTLIQCGTEQDSIGGQIVYGAWYELLPRSAVTIRSFVVSPGDQMQTTIQLVDATLNEWLLNITDVTSGSTFQNNFTYASTQLSAEWIVERPTINGVLGTLANFGNVTFTECQAFFDSTSGVIGSFTKGSVVMYSSISPGVNGVQLTNVSDIGADGASFTVTYLSSG